MQALGEAAVRHEPAGHRSRPSLRTLHQVPFGALRRRQRHLTTLQDEEPVTRGGRKALKVTAGILQGGLWDAPLTYLIPVGASHKPLC
jgi:hypothetical protein